MFDQETEKMSSQSYSNSLISLQEVLLSKTVQNSDKAEYYTMAYLDHECNGGQQDIQKTIIVKRIDFIFNDKNCKVINFTDISTYNRLQR